jgi:hypothetical protein
MKALSVVCAVAALLICAAIPLKSFAEDDAKKSAAQIAEGQTKAGVANTLVIIGRSAKDPDMRATTRASATTNIGATA